MYCVLSGEGKAGLLHNATWRCSFADVQLNSHRNVRLSPNGLITRNPVKRLSLASYMHIVVH